MGHDLMTFLAGGRGRERDPIPLGELTLRAPIPHPSKIVCVGLNYRDHAEESGQPVPDHPILFPKFANSVIGPGEPIVRPVDTEQPDDEGPHRWCSASPN